MESAATTLETHTQPYYGLKLPVSLLAFTKLQRLFVEMVISNTNEMLQSAMTQWEKTCICNKAKQNLRNARDRKKPQFGWDDCKGVEWSLIIFPVGSLEEETIFD